MGAECHWCIHTALTATGSHGKAKELWRTTAAFQCRSLSQHHKALLTGPSDRLLDSAFRIRADIKQVLRHLANLSHLSVLSMSRHFRVSKSSD